jgi:rare lipoprotein A
LLGILARRWQDAGGRKLWLIHTHFRRDDEHRVISFAFRYKALRPVCGAENRGDFVMRTLLALPLGAMLLLAPAAAGAQSGMASWYKMGRVTASGERYRPLGLTAAHRTLKFGTRVKVTNLRTGRSVIVRINDRGPFIRGRIIDLSLGAAQLIGLTKSGTARVMVTVLK